ncbi:Ppx/GppA phosphatase family protein [Anaeromicropila populeti]|uniref:Exopolyphosphatase / guanosine-5'-triphosphate,3'-diphosphate pyrophosphatase n=1 Tax=Anaeromicropila populeti TaxID=37658 RepID=A0A1I6L4H2_9FIRM|nr:HD domain-containing protein [Anaeromicropila populeti]SFR98317.1 exopolyphosphatase / guanosine-5'-triphosphate,3'-diphosphate pyrophosphatase [Anaeromicropila populeti]
MPITTFAAIDVGSNEISLKIFDISKKYGINEVDHVRHTIELGSETYKYGKISSSLVNELCDVLKGFTEKMKEYNVQDYIAYATSAIREASNSVLILDQIKLRSQIKVKIISNSEQRFLCCKAIALKESSFQKIIEKGTAIVDVSSGSMQITLFDKGSLICTQNIKLGSLRIREMLSDLENKTDDYHNLISEYINNDLKTFSDLLFKYYKIEHIIAVGEQLNEFMFYAEERLKMQAVPAKEFKRIFEKISKKSLESISTDLSISKEQASLVLPTAMIYNTIFTETNAQNIYFSDITLCDGIAADYAEKKEKIISGHDFVNDIVSAAKNIASRYHCNSKHTENVEYLSLSIYDGIRKLHGLGKRERLLLQIAVILHSCGEYINMNSVQENSYNIVMSTEIIGLSHHEREIVANLVRYNTQTFPRYTHLIAGLDKDTYIKISKLLAILQIANAMDKSHKQKFSAITLSLKQTVLTITTDTLEDITLESGLFEKKATFFEEVYGIKPLIKQKRSKSL